MHAPGTDDGRRSLPRALVRLMLAVEDAYTAASRELGLTAQQAQLLCLSRRAAPIGELAHALRCDRSNVSRIVDRAESRGLVRRRPDASDRRLAVVELTDSGGETMRSFIATLDARIRDLVAGWPPERQELAVEILGEVAAALEAGTERPGMPKRPTAVPSLRGI